MKTIISLKIAIIMAAMCVHVTFAQQKAGTKKTTSTTKPQAKTGTKTQPKTNAQVKTAPTATTFLQTADGLKYVFHKNVPTETVKISDIVEIHFKMFAKVNGKDTLLRNTWAEKKTVPVQITEDGGFKGDVLDGLKLMSVGDSMSCFSSADSVFKGMKNLPFEVQKQSDVRYEITVLSVKNFEQYQQEEQQKQNEMMIEQQKVVEQYKAIDDAIIRKHLADNTLQAERTDSGFFYTIVTQGTGKKVEVGDKIAIHYTGTLLSGKKFDSSLDRGEPLAFDAGRGQMIKGFDEAVLLLNNGGKIIMYLPSHLAYGARGAGGDIPPFSVLKFEVQMMTVNGQ